MKTIILIAFLYFGNCSFGQVSQQFRIFKNLTEWNDSIHIEASVDSFWNKYRSNVKDSLISRVSSNNYVIVFRLNKSKNLNQLYLETYNDLGSQIGKLLVCERKQMNSCILYKNFFLDKKWIGIYGTTNFKKCSRCSSDNPDQHLYISDNQIDDDGQILIVL